MNTASPRPAVMGQTRVCERTRIAELVERIEASERQRDQWTYEMNRHLTNSQAYRGASIEAGYHDRVLDTARAELRALLGVDAYRLCNAVGG